MEVTCGSSRRQWWADASVNDGLFVRRDADDETFIGFVARRQGGEGCQRDPRFLFLQDDREHDPAR